MTEKVVFGDEFKKVIFADKNPKVVFGDEFKKHVFDIDSTDFLLIGENSFLLIGSGNSKLRI